MDFLSDFVSSLEERRVYSSDLGQATNMTCWNCQSPLIETEFNNGFVAVCDNFRCPTFRISQSIRMKEKIVLGIGGRTWRAGYLEELRKAKENYQCLCRMGIRAKIAATHKSNKQTKRIQAMVKRGLSVTYINEALR